MASDNSSLRQKLERVANSPTAAPLEREAARRRLAKLVDDGTLSAEDILSVDDSAYGEREVDFIRRTAPVKVRRVKVVVE